MRRKKTKRELQQAAVAKRRMLVARDPDADSRRRTRKTGGRGAPRFTPERVRAFCLTLASTANVTKSALTIGVSRISLYKWREQYPDFAEAWDAAMKVGLTILEDEAVRRAGPDGVDEGVYYQGEKVNTEKRYSDTLLTFLLSAHKPEVYGKQRLEHTGKDGAPLPPVQFTVEFVKAKAK